MSAHHRDAFARQLERDDHSARLDARWTAYDRHAEPTESVPPVHTCAPPPEKPRPRVCGKCFGRQEMGSVVQRDPVTGAYLWSEPLQPIPCDRCGGTGEEPSGTHRRIPHLTREWCAYLEARERANERVRAVLRDLDETPPDAA